MSTHSKEHVRHRYPAAMGAFNVFATAEPRTDQLIFGAWMALLAFGVLPSEQSNRGRWQLSRSAAPCCGLLG